MKVLVFCICAFVYLALIAGSKSLFHRFWFNKGIKESNFDELSDDASSWVAATFWPIFIVCLGLKLLAELIEKEWKEKEPPHAAD